MMMVHKVFGEKVKILNFFSFVDVGYPCLMGNFGENLQKQNSIKMSHEKNFTTTLCKLVHFFNKN
jgi:hypothetical protein